MSSSSTKQDTSEKPTAAATASKEDKKPTKQSLEEDDEFEDFPVEDWTEEDSQLPGGNAHLWEESWDDDDTSDDFAVQLRAELKKLGKVK